MERTSGFLEPGLDYFELLAPQRNVEFKIYNLKYPLSSHKDHQYLYIAGVYAADAAGLSERAGFYFFELL